MSFARALISSRTQARTAAGIAARAFADDPLFSWIAFHEPSRLTVLEQVMDAMIAMRRPKGAFLDELTAGRGVLVIEAPGERSSTMDEWLSFAPRLARLLPTFARVGERGKLLRRAAAGFATLDAIAALRPNEPHMYIAVLTVDPTSQRNGIGGRLLRGALAEADAAHVPAHLETARPANIAYYERFGFAVQHEVQKAGAPPVWVMTRRAR